MQSILPHIEETELPPDCYNLPDGWKNVRLGAVATISSGGTPSRTVPKYWGGDVPWLTTSAINFNIITEPSEMITEEGLKQSSAKVFPQGTVLMAMIGQGMTRGRVAIMGLTAAISQNCAAIQPSTKVLSSYLFYSLMSSYYEIRSIGNGGGQTNLNAHLIRSIRLCLPEIREQAHIVEILDAADTAVHSAENLVEAKLRYKRALADQLLTGKRRFPEFEEQHWQKVRLGKYLAEKSERYPANEIPIVLSCSKLYGILPQSERFSKQLASQDLRRYKFVEPGDLVFDPMLLWDASISFSELRGVVSPAYCTLRFISEDVDRQFFRYLLYTATMRHTYKAISQGTNARRKKVLASDFLNVKVQMPCQAEQRKIASVLGLVDEEIALLRRELELLKQQKQGLMQKLLTGQVRVKEFAP